MSRAPSGSHRLELALGSLVNVSASCWAGLVAITTHEMQPRQVGAIVETLERMVISRVAKNSTAHEILQAM